VDKLSQTSAKVDSLTGELKNAKVKLDDKDAEVRRLEASLTEERNKAVNILHLPLRHVYVAIIVGELSVMRFP